MIVRIPRALVFLHMTRSKYVLSRRERYFRVRFTTLIVQVLLQVIDLVVSALILKGTIEYSDMQLRDTGITIYIAQGIISILLYIIIDGYFCQVVRQYRDNLRHLMTIASNMTTLPPNPNRVSPSRA